MEDLAVLENCEFIGRLFFVLRNGFPSDLLICIVHEERSMVKGLLIWTYYPNLTHYLCSYNTCYVYFPLNISYYTLGHP